MLTLSAKMAPDLLCDCPTWHIREHILDLVGRASYRMASIALYLVRLETEPWTHRRGVSIPVGSRHSGSTTSSTVHASWITPCSAASSCSSRLSKVYGRQASFEVEHQLPNSGQTNLLDPSPSTLGLVWSKRGPSRPTLDPLRPNLGQVGQPRLNS